MGPKDDDISDSIMVHEQIAIVTGAAKGIGRYIAHTFVREGTKVAIVDIDSDRLHKVSDELGRITTDILTIKADVRNEGEVRRMVDQVVDHFSHIDVLVNDAAIVTHSAWAPLWSRIRDMDKAFWDRIMETNLGGTFLCTKHVLPYMEARRSGHIINLHGGGHGIGACAYVVSKEAILTFTRFVADEEREWNICVVVVSPGGAIATEDAPEADRRGMPGMDFVGNRFVLAAQSGMEFTGQLLTLKDGRLEIINGSKR